MLLGALARTEWIRRNGDPASQASAAEGTARNPAKSSVLSMTASGFVDARRAEAFSAHAPIPGRESPEAAGSRMDEAGTPEYTALHLRHRLYILGAAVLWSTAGAAIKLSTLNSWQLAAGRSLFAALALYVLLPEGRQLPKGRAWLVSMAYAATVSLFVVANKLTTAANAIFLQDAAPLYILLLSPWLLNERPTRSELFAVPVFLVGLSLFFADQLSAGQLWGNAVAIVAGVAFALCIIGLRWAQQQSSSVLLAGNGLVVVALGPLALWGPAPLAADWGLLAFLGVFQLGLAYRLFSRGLSATPAIEASLLMLLEPVLSPLWTYLSTGERPGPFALTGGAVILAATVWRTLAAARIEQAGARAS